MQTFATWLLRAQNDSKMTTPYYNFDDQDGEQNLGLYI